MRLLLVTLLALTVAVVAGHYLANDPGFIVIGYGGKVVRTTFAFFLVALLLGLAALYLALRLLLQLFGLRRRWRRWSGDHRRRRAHRALADGLLALAGGEAAKAEKLFARGIDVDAQPEVHYLAAAEAAQAQRAAARRDNYLMLARDLNPEAGSTLDLKRAGWLLDNGELDAAADQLASLAASQAANPRFLLLRARYLAARGEHGALLGLLPSLRRDRVLPAAEADALEQSSAAAALAAAAAGGSAALDAAWNGLSRNVRAASPVYAAYVRALVTLGRVDQAENLLVRQLERRWDGELAALYGELPCEPPTRQLRAIEDFARSHGDDPGLMLARARITLRAGLWGQARAQLEALLAAAPSPLVHRLLAEAAEGAGDVSAAEKHRRRGLELATAAPA